MKKIINTASLMALTCLILPVGKQTVLAAAGSDAKGNFPSGTAECSRLCAVQNPQRKGDCPVKGCKVKAADRDEYLAKRSSCDGACSGCKCGGGYKEAHLN